MGFERLLFCWISLVWTFWVFGLIFVLFDCGLLDLCFGVRVLRFWFFDVFGGLAF